MPKFNIRGEEVVENVPSTTTPTLVKLNPGTQLDAFGRLRTSEPQTIFDSKQVFDNAPLFWDDAEVSGGSTTSSHSVNTAATTLGVALNTAGNRVRQTFMRFNYLPGKSQLILMTGVLDKSGGGTGITRNIGLFDAENGCFFQDDEGTIKVVVRSYTSGAAVDTKVAQSSWNVDTMDGNGDSGITLDFSKTQIFVIDFEWLGVGTVRFGVVVDGVLYYVHYANNANSSNNVFMSTPNLPLRYEIDNDGTGAASTIDHICTSVISEGGLARTGAIRYKSTAGTHIEATTADAAFVLVGLRLKTTHLDASILLESASVLCETNDDFEWFIILNPTLGASATFGDETNSAVQSCVGESSDPSTTTYSSGGVILQGGFAASSAPITEALSNAIRLGANIAGTRDEIYLMARPLTANANIQGSLSWRELS